MVVLLDTADLPPGVRTDCVLATSRDATAPSQVVLVDVRGDGQAGAQRWRLGNVVVFRSESSGIRIPVDQLGLPVEVIRRAGAGLPASPLYRLVTDHIAHLTANAERLSADPAAPALGAASIELVRALLSSAGSDHRSDHRDDTRGAIEGGTDPMLTELRGYVRRHLRDPELRPASIAAAHSISLRQLYKLCAQAGFSLEQWIIAQRLDGARQELSRPAGSRRSVAVIARSWGFSDPTHFSRRFRAAYGMTPRDWRGTDH